MALGKRQISMLRTVGTTSMLVTTSPRARRLIELGLLYSDRPDGAGATITSAGLRALADASDAGQIDLRSGYGRDK